MLVVCQTLNQDCQRVRDELSLVGLQVHVHKGAKDTVAEEMEAPWDAIVLVSNDGSHSIWARHGQPASAVEPVEVRPAKGESRESVALRSAELVRGELLPENTQASSRGPQVGVLSPVASRPAFAVTTGPALLASSYGGVAGGWTAELSYWFERFSLGVFATGALTKTPWTPADKEVNQQQLTAGILAKGLLLRTLTNRFDLVLAGGIGARSQWLSGRAQPGPMDSEGFRGVAVALAIPVQVEASYAFYPWFALGGALGGTVGIPLSFPEPTDDLKKKASDALIEANEQRQLDGLFQASVLLIFRF